MSKSPFFQSLVLYFQKVFLFHLNSHELYRCAFQHFQYPFFTNLNLLCTGQGFCRYIYLSQARSFQINYSHQSLLQYVLGKYFAIDFSKVKPAIGPFICAYYFVTGKFCNVLAVKASGPSIAVAMAFGLFLFCIDWPAIKIVAFMAYSQAFENMC